MGESGLKDITAWGAGLARGTTVSTAGKSTKTQTQSKRVVQKEGERVKLTLTTKKERVQLSQMSCTSNIKK